MSDSKLPNKYVEAEAEARRFLAAIKLLREVYEKPTSDSVWAPDWRPIPERAAAKRASLDLTRALARMRRT